MTSLETRLQKRRRLIENRQYVNFWFLLGLMFIGLKLTGHIDWSWWWVLLPIYGKMISNFFGAVLDHSLDERDRKEHG